MQRFFELKKNYVEAKEPQWMSSAVFESGNFSVERTYYLAFLWRLAISVHFLTSPIRRVLFMKSSKKKKTKVRLQIKAHIKFHNVQIAYNHDIDNRLIASVHVDLILQLTHIYSISHHEIFQYITWVPYFIKRQCNSFFFNCTLNHKIIAYRWLLLGLRQSYRADS